MYTWEDNYTFEGYETTSIRVLVYIIRRAYREHGSRLPRGIRIMKDGKLWYALWYTEPFITDVSFQELPTMARQAALAEKRLYLLGQRWMLDYDEYALECDARQNMPCDTYGMCACTSSCSRYHECYGCK